MLRPWVVPRLLEPQVFGFVEQVPQGGSSPQDIAKPLVFPRDSLSPKDNSTGHRDKRPLYIPDERDEKSVPESTVLVVPVHSSPVHSSQDLPIIFPMILCTLIEGLRSIGTVHVFISLMRRPLRRIAWMF